MSDILHYIKDILLSVCLPHFICPPCLEYLFLRALILLRLWRYINHVLICLLTYLLTYLLIISVVSVCLYVCMYVPLSIEREHSKALT